MPAFKKLAALALALTMILSLAACGAAEAEPDVTSPQGSSSAGSYTVTDIFGREVEIPGEVQSVAALGSAARLLCYMDATDKLTGVTAMDLEPTASKPYSYIYAEELAGAEELATGGSNDTAYAEAIVVADPDVIFYFDSDTAAMDDLARQTGLPVVGVYAEYWYDEDTFFASLELIGQICGRQERAQELISALRGWKEELAALSAGVPEEEKPTVYAGAVNWSGSHGIEGSYGQYPPFVAAGANNVVDSTGADAFVEIDREQITAWDPDYIFLTVDNMGIVNEDYAQNPNYYDTLSAVQEGHVYSQVGFNYYWTNQELAVVNSYYVASVLYPEAFEGVDFEARAEEIFNTMLGSDFLDVLEENGMYFGPVTIGG